MHWDKPLIGASGSVRKHLCLLSRAAVRTRSESCIATLPSLREPFLRPSKLKFEPQTWNLRLWVLSEISTFYSVFFFSAPVYNFYPKGCKMRQIFQTSSDVNYVRHKYLHSRNSIIAKKGCFQYYDGIYFSHPTLFRRKFPPLGVHSGAHAGKE